MNEYVYNQHTGKQERKPRWITNLKAANDKAAEIAAALSAGKSDVLRWQDEQARSRLRDERARWHAADHRAGYSPARHKTFFGHAKGSGMSV